MPASEFLLPPGGATQLRDRLGTMAPRLPERLAADLARFEGADDPLREAAPVNVGGATRALAVGDAAEVWAPYLATATGFDHVDPGTLLVIDEPADLAKSTEFLWRQAQRAPVGPRRSRGMPGRWPVTYLGPRDWKGRLVGSRTLELTWESEPPAGTAMAAPLDAQLVFGWREPHLPLGRSARLPDAVETWQQDEARIVLASDQAPRLAEILAEAGHPAAVVAGLSEAPPPGASRSSSAASTAGSPAAPRTSRSSPTASCSGTSGSAGQRRCGGSCHATSSNG